MRKWNNDFRMVLTFHTSLHRVRKRTCKSLIGMCFSHSGEKVSLVISVDKENRFDHESRENIGSKLGILFNCTHFYTLIKILCINAN